VSRAIVRQAERFASTAENAQDAKCAKDRKHLKRAFKA